jgi:hypothetical protein
MGVLANEILKNIAFVGGEYMRTGLVMSRRKGGSWNSAIRMGEEISGRSGEI